MSHNLNQENWGITATCRDVLGALRLLVEDGRPEEALRAVCRRCDEDGLRIVSLSSPQTILADLRRDPGRPETCRKPEPFMLGRSGRLDLLA